MIHELRRVRKSANAISIEKCPKKKGDGAHSLEGRKSSKKCPSSKKEGDIDFHEARNALKGKYARGKKGERQEDNVS